jgi:hypothetical protein
MMNLAHKLAVRLRRAWRVLVAWPLTPEDWQPATAAERDWRRLMLVYGAVAVMSLARIVYLLQNWR